MEARQQQEVRLGTEATAPDLIAPEPELGAVLTDIARLTGRSGLAGHFKHGLVGALGRMP